MSDQSRPHRNFGYWLTIFANLAVVGGIIFLGLEIRQNTDMMEAQINQSRTETAMSQQQATYNSDYVPRILAAIENGETLSDEDMERYEAWFRGFNRNMDNQLWQYEQGFLGPNIPRSMRFAVQEVVGGSQLGMEEWERQKLSYSDQYIAFVEEAIADLRSEVP